MLKIAGQMLDLYDDAELAALRAAVPDGELRKFAAMTVLEPVELDALDDSTFGAILFDGPDKTASRRRAWPCHDQDNTEISLVYFLKAASDGWMPEEMRNQVASNIVAHCDLYQMEVEPEMRKWASDHGEWIPADNFVDLSMLDPIGPQAPSEFAIEKTASGERLGFYPCGSAEEVSASATSLLTEGCEVYGLDSFEGRKVAAVLMSKAAELDVAIPDELVAMGSMEKRSSSEIHGLLLHRLDRVDAEKRARLGGDLQSAMDEIESEEDPVKQAGFIGALDTALGFHEGHYLTGIPRPMDVVFRTSKLADLSEVPLLDKIGRDRIEEVCGAGKLAEFEKDAAAALEGCEPEVRELLLNGTA